MAPYSPIARRIRRGFAGTLYEALAAEYDWYALYAQPFSGGTGPLVDLSGNGRDLPVRGAPVLADPVDSFGQGYDDLAADFAAADSMADNFSDPQGAINVTTRIGGFCSHVRTSSGTNHRLITQRGIGTGSRLLLYVDSVSTISIFTGSLYQLAWFPSYNQKHLLGYTHDPGAEVAIWVNGHKAKEQAIASSIVFPNSGVVTAVGGDTFGNTSGRSGGEYNLAAFHADAGLDDATLGRVQSQIMLGEGVTNYYWDKVHQYRANLHFYAPFNDPGGTVALDGSGQENFGTYSGAILGEDPVDDRFVRSTYLASTADVVFPARDWTGSSWTAFGHTTTTTSLSRALACVDPTRASGGDIRLFPVGGRMNFSWHDGTSTVNVDTTDGVSSDVPYFWTVRYDHAAQTIAVWVDGAKKEEASVAGLTMPDLSTYDFTVNQSFGLASGFHNVNGWGCVNAALTDEQIEELAA